MYIYIYIYVYIYIYKLYMSCTNINIVNIYIIYIIYIYRHIYTNIYEHNVWCSVTSEPFQSSSRRVSSFKGSSTLLNN